RNDRSELNQIVCVNISHALTPESKSFRILYQNRNYTPKFRSSHTKYSEIVTVNLFTAPHHFHDYDRVLTALSSKQRFSIITNHGDISVHDNLPFLAPHLLHRFLAFDGLRKVFPIHLVTFVDPNYMRYEIS